MYSYWSLWWPVKYWTKTSLSDQKHPAFQSLLSGCMCILGHIFNAQVGSFSLLISLDFPLVRAVKVSWGESYEPCHALRVDTFSSGHPYKCAWFSVFPRSVSKPLRATYGHRIPQLFLWIFWPDCFGPYLYVLCLLSAPLAAVMFNNCHSFPVNTLFYKYTMRELRQIK